MYENVHQERTPRGAAGFVFGIKKGVGWGWNHAPIYLLICLRYRLVARICEVEGIEGNDSVEAGLQLAYFFWVVGYITAGIVFFNLLR